MLQAMLKHCFGQCSSNASAMLKHAEELPPVRVVRTTYGEPEQIMRGRRRRGRSAVQSLIAKLVAGLG